jgi:hypothetical protein
LTPVPYAITAENVPGLSIQQTADGAPNLILGYSGNTVASGVYGATISGGGENGTVNSVTVPFGTVSGGIHNTASGQYASTVSGGNGNTASAAYSTVSGGVANTASGKGAFVGGGGYDGSTFGGNTAGGNASVVGGGLNNIVNGDYATVAGGANNTAGGQYSFAAGQEAQALNNGSFVWADDSSSSPFASTANNQFLIKAAGGVGIGTSTPNAPLAVVGNIYMGTQRANTTFNQIGDTIYLGAEQKFLGNTLGISVDGSTDWINLMANSLSAGIMFGVSSSTANPHSNITPLMVIKSNGNVGIGATNPVENLTIAGVTGYNSGLKLTGSTTGGTGMALENTAAGGHKYDFVSGGAGSTEGAGAFALFDETAGSFRLTVSTNGNVGIGTATPATTLDVNGQISAGSLRSPGAGINSSTFAFTQLAVGTNTTGNGTVIHNPLTDGDPNAILIITHNWTADTNSTSKYNIKPVGVYYSGPNWIIFNEDTSTMALGRAFNVMVIKP